MKPLFFLLLACIASGYAGAQHESRIHEFDFLAGKWKVETHLRLSAQGPWDTSVARSVITWSLKSTILVEEYTGTKQGKPFLIKSIFGYNNANGLLQKTFADSEHGVLVLFEGSRHKDTVYLDKSITFSNGNTVRLRTAYYLISEREFLVVGMRMPGGANEWDVTSRMRYKRED